MIGIFLVVADIGGLLGFFLGCSILSLIEIIYFIFEMCCNKLKNRLNNQKQIQSNKNLV